MSSATRMSVASLVLAFALAAGAPLPTAHGSELVLRVVDDATDAPIADAQISVRIDKKRENLATDEGGTCILDFDEEQVKYVSITAKANEYVPRIVQWRGEKGLLDLPVEHTFKLGRGTTIGGVVKNEQGEPLGDVAVPVSSYGGINQNGQDVVYLRNTKLQTDPAGKWQCDLAPKDLSRLSLNISHPDYMPLRMWGASGGFSASGLRSMSAEFVLKKGLAVLGKVIDEEGWGIAEAEVMAGESRYSSGRLQTKTGPEGNFRAASIS